MSFASKPQGFKKYLLKQVTSQVNDNIQTSQSTNLSLRTEAKKLFSLLNPALVPGRGLVIQLISAHSGEGVSTIARELAIVASEHAAGPVLLADFDWGSSTQFRYFMQPDKALSHGPLHTVQECKLDASLLIRSSKSRDPCWLEFLHVGESNLVICRLQALDPQSVHISNAPQFWDTVRSRFGITVVDSSSATKSLDGITICGSMDAVIVIVAAESTRSYAVRDLCEKLRAQNAPLVGLVFNKRKLYIPSQVYRWMSRL